VKSGKTFFSRIFQDDCFQFENAAFPFYYLAIDYLMRPSPRKGAIPSLSTTLVFYFRTGCKQNNLSTKNFVVPFFKDDGCSPSVLHKGASVVWTN